MNLWRWLKRLLVPPERRTYRHVTDNPEDAARVVDEARAEGWRLERTTREGGSYVLWFTREGE